MQGDALRCSSALLAAAALSLVALSCGERVKVGEDLAGTGGSPNTGGGGYGHGGDGGGGDGGGGYGGGTPDPFSPLALLYSQFGEPGAGGGAPDPDTLFLFLGTRPHSCQDPHGEALCGTWMVSIGIPPALQVPGALPLAEPDLITLFSLEGPDEGGGMCFGGGGSYTDGTLTLLSLSAAQVAFRLEGTGPDPVADGEYVAPRCP